MEGGARKLLETATIETLHAHNFSRSSTQATHALTDLLSRYLTLLSTSCARYAEHAGRLRLTARDAVSVLDELGVGVDELSEYCAGEAKDLSRYAVHTARRIEDLNEFKASFANGLREDRDDAIPLVYGRVPSPVFDEEGAESESGEETQESEEEATTPDIAILQEDGATTAMDASGESDGALIKRGKKRAGTPTLPLSPISNPSTPARKRARTASWRPPSHIPDFLPPFPTDSPRHSPSPPPQDTSAPSQPVKLERPPSPLPQPQMAASTSSADYLTAIPYPLSTLASTPSWHLPSAPPLSPAPSVPTFSRLPIPQTQPALLGAYHHVLTHPPADTVTPATPARYKVALGFLAQSEATPRWDPGPTLFSTAAPNFPRVAAIGPTYPAPIVETKSEKEENDKDKKSNLPMVPPRPVVACERITPLLSQQVSRLPQVARRVLPNSVYNRTTRLTHPPVLFRGNQRLTYGPGVNAPWNSGVPTPATTPALGKSKDGHGSNGLPNGKDAAAPAKALPDARLYATWNYEQKHYQDPTMSKE
ncbi:hypothetical protein SCP_1003970 [Sparassis crispa]|uniref:Bromodomain associated domain-containing protein n=1 Tax=Sparassis crispa TaxID=139825 RepID=A0A401GY90_9APHY|nr:hypothetical protein SCP_1003970 [Sparassis crispa]GBE87150.1 hypothetical protein SCP_1003970 [Sparassis crispa]